MRLNKRTLLLSLILSLPVVLLVTAAILQRHTATRHAIANYLSTVIRNTVDCNFTMQVKEVTILPLTLTCINVQANPRSQTPDNAWHWQCNQIIFRCSWLNLITRKKISTSLSIDQLQASSTASEQGLAITPHLQQLFFGQSAGIPLSIKGVKINQLTCQIHAPNNTAYIAGSLLAKKTGTLLKTTFYFTDGSLMRNQTALITQLTGILNSAIEHNAPQQLWGNMSFNAPWLPLHTQQCAVTGQLRDHQATGTLHNQDRTFDLQLILDTATHRAQAEGHIESSLLYDLFKTPEPLRIIRDTLDIHATINGATLESQATFTLRTLPIKGFWHSDKTAYQGALTIQHPCPIACLYNWQIMPEQCSLSFAGNLIKHTTQLQVTAKNLITHHTITTKLDGILTDGAFTVNGTLNQYPISCSGALYPRPHVDHLKLTKNNQTIIDIQLEHQPPLTLNATVSYEQAHQWLPEWIRSHIPGSGIITLRGIIMPQNWQFNLTMHKGNIIIERLFNVITDVQANLTIDFLQQLITLDDTKLTLQQGVLTIPHATCAYHKTFIPLFVHLPLSMHQCTANILHSDATVSGGLCIRYQHNAPSTIQGSLIIDKAHIRNAMQLSDTPTNEIFTTLPIVLGSIKLAIGITNKKPLHINTPTFTGKASVSCTVHNQLNNPQWAGTITLHEGLLHMPTYSLRINRGTIYANPHNIVDPLIDIQAQTTIDQYVVRVDLTGTANQPTLHLQASPPLNEEQIALLLVAGSTDSMLNSAAPALLMDNLAHYVTGKIFYTPTGDTLWSKIFKQLKHVKLIPQFNEQANLQGISGAIEIDLGKKIKAKIQKNLMIDEQATVELDYKLSDEVSVKTFKNEQGDLGSVLQMRLKL